MTQAEGPGSTTTNLRAPRPGVAVVAKGVTIEVGGRRILDGVDLALEPGTLTALTGASGAGKTTLLWVLAAALVPTRGSVTLAGQPVTDRTQAARAGVALIPQGVSLVTPLTARENVLVSLLVHDVPAGEASARADAALADVRLADSGSHLVEELSGGQQQRVAVARGLALRHGVLLADEPTSELDAANRDVVLDLLRLEAEAGAVVLLATHDPWCAERADAEYHLDEGRLERRR